MLIAPMSANTMGKIANGLCDNLLVSERTLFSSCKDKNLKNPTFT